MKSVLEFHRKKREKSPISLVTCYDYWTARIIESTPVDCVLVGDSLAMVMHGFSSTLHATVEMMALHTAAVARGAPGKLLIADMPFLTFRKGRREALDCVDRLMKAGAQAIKLEGVRGHEEVVSAIVGSGVPVMGHLGLTPQSIHQLGGFRVQGRDPRQVVELIEDAKTLENLGCFSLVLECVPSEVAARVTSILGIPTIGIGAGRDTDGQVLVLQDLLGGNSAFRPKFVRTFLDAEGDLTRALTAYHESVAARAFPSDQESYE